MAQKLTASMPEGLVVNNGYTIAFTAVDAASGAVLAAVNVSHASLLVEQLAGGDPGDLESGPFLLVPGPEA